MPALVHLIARRLGTALIVLIGVSVLIFAIARIIPGDPARIALGPNASAEQVEQLRNQLHLDEPFLTQYAYFVGDMMQGNLGISLYTNRPVTADIAQFLPATLELVFLSGLLMMLIGLPLGILAARYRGTWVDHAIRLVTLLGVSAPSFVWAVILMLVFAFYTPLFPIAGRLSDTISVPTVTGFLFIDTLLAGDIRAFADAAWHIILPAIALALPGHAGAVVDFANFNRAPEWPYIFGTDLVGRDLFSRIL